MIDENRTIYSPEVKVVEASAGSGKTYQLAKRYLQLILNEKSYPELIRNILAITFTNAASREMKENILDFLKKIALDKFSDPQKEKDIYSSLNISRETAQQKALVLMDYIVHNYNFFQVQTIDSFINILLSGCSYKLDISSKFKIKDNYKDFLSYSLDKIVQKALEDKELKDIFDNFIKQYLFLEDKLSWFPKNDIFLLVDSLFKYIVSYGKSFAKFDLKNQNLFLEKKKIINLIQLLQQKVPEGTNKRFLNSLDAFLEEEREYFDFKDLSNYFKRKKFPINKGHIIPEDVNRIWQDIKKRLNQVSEKEALSLFNWYIDIFLGVYEFFKNNAINENIIFLSELNIETRKLFEGGITVPELYYRLATRFHHFLIDEFQDTSLLQWQNLSMMIEEALSCGGSLFYVGDKKQAIYRFRGGEVSLFDSIKDDLSNFNVKTNLLSKNFRSQKVIVEFNNKIFSQDNLYRFIKECQPQKEESCKYLSEDSINEILNYFKDSQQTYIKDEPKGYVNIKRIECESIDERNTMVKKSLIDKVNELKRRFHNLGDIAILVNSNKDVELVSGWLIEENISVESEKTLNIKNNRFIKEIVSFLKFLNSPIDNISFVSFICGDIFTLVSGINKEEINQFLIKQKDKYNHKNRFYIYRAFRENYPDAWKNYIQDFFRNVGLVGFYELVVDILQKMQVLKNFSCYHGFFMHFLDMLKEKEEDYQSLGDFLEYFEQAEETDYKFYVNSSTKDSIKVRTIHKSKGLEFSVVVLPFCEFDKNRLSPGGSRKVSYVARQQKDNIILVRLDQKYTDFSPKVKNIYRDEYKKSFIDELNTIYVACTRAKYELHIFTPIGIKQKGDIIEKLISQDVLEYGKPCKIEGFKKEDKSQIVEIPPADYKGWIAFLKEEFMDIYALKNRNEILKGKMFHYILSEIGNLKGKSMKSILKKAFDEMKMQFPEIKDFSSFKIKVNSLLESKEMKRFFYLDKAEIFTEKEIVDKQGYTKRIDRLIIKKDKKQIWVIDYKLKGELIEEYRNQVLEYMRLVEQIYPGFKIKGFIIFIKNLKIEEIYEK